MRPIVIAPLIAALLGVFGLALGRSAANAVGRAVARHTARVERALSFQQGVLGLGENPCRAGVRAPFLTSALGTSFTTSSSASRE